MDKDGKIKFSQGELRRLSRKSTKIYLKNVMKKLYSTDWEASLEKLLSGDRQTFDFCARCLGENLDFFPLLHTLCLITHQRFDLEDEDRAKAADAWVCWYNENKNRLIWDLKGEFWTVSKSRN